MDAAAHLRVDGEQSSGGEARSLEQIHSSIVDSRDLFPPVRSGFPIFSSPPDNGIELQIHQPIHEARALATQSLCCNAYL